MMESSLTPKQRRSLTQFNIRALLLIMVLSGLSTVYFGRAHQEMRTHQTAVNQLMSAHANIYNDQVDSNGYYRPGWSILPNTLRGKIFGKRGIYMADYDGTIRELARENPYVTLKSLANLSTKSTRDLKFLSPLDKIEDLDLSGQRCLESLAGIDNLSELKTLKLYRCNRLTNLNGLAKLPRLYSLDIRGCTSLNATRWLDSLQHLEILKKDKSIQQPYLGW